MNIKESVFLLCGPETGEKETFIQTTIEQFEKEKKAKADIYKFFAFDASCLEIVSLLRNGLLFSDCKAVIVLGAENFKKTDAELLTAYITQPSPGTLLFLCTDEKRLPWHTIDEAILPRNKKIFWELLEHQKKGWVKNFFNKRSLAIEDDALDFIIEMVENNTKDLQATCERLEIFFGKSGAIRYEDIENFIYHSKEENVFTLFYGIVKRDFSLSLEILDKILLSHDEDPIRILSGILWQVHQCIQFITLLQEQYSLEKAFQKLLIKTKRQQKLLNEVKDRYSLKDLYRIVGFISEFDTMFRIYNQNCHRILLELFLYKIETVK